MPLRKLLVHFILIIGLLPDSNAQSLSFHHYTAEDGLPSSELYDIAFDKDGFMWVAGEGGISRFDGHVFLKSPIKEMAKEEVIKMEIDQNSRLWMLSLSGKFAFFGEDSLTFINDLEKSNKYDYIEIHNDKNGNVWLTDINHIYVLPYRDGVYDKSIKKLERFKDEKYKIIATISDSTVIILTAKGVYRFQNFDYTYDVFEQPLPDKGPRFGMAEGDSVIFCVQNRLYSYHNKRHEISPILEQFNDYFNAGVLSFLKEDNGSYWIATKNGLVHLVEQNDEYQLTRYLEGVVMGQIKKDYEGNYWFSTEHAGMYFLSAKEVIVLDEVGTKPLSVAKTTKQGEIVLGFLDNSVKVLDQNFKLVFQDKIFEEYHRIYDLLITEKDDYYFFTAGGCVRYNKHFERQILPQRYGYKSAKFGPDGSIWVTSATLGGRLEGDFCKEKVLQRSYSVLPVGKNEAWFGTVEGLCYYDGEKVSFVENELLQQDIRGIERDDKGCLWLATQGDGLVHYDPAADSVLYHFTADNGLLSNNCKQVMYVENSLWLVTSKGLNKLNPDDRTVLSMDSNEGLPSFETNNIHRDGDRLYVASNRGLAYFDKNIKLERIPPLLHITGVKIEERDTSIVDNYELSFRQNNIKIEFVGVSYRHAKNVKYRFKMEGVDNDWVETNLTTAQYPSMPSGEFNFFVKTKTVNSGWSEEKKIRFLIYAPYWKTGWFIFLISFLGLLALAGTYYLIIRDVKLRNEKTKKITIAQLTALRAQMNPHFVFNALNSIQDFILRSDSRAANRYLSMFARLMRNVLHFSDKEKISLKKELDSIELYLNLEGLRLDDDFTYAIQIDPSLHPERILIPPMLIQPFVENSIKHGLMHKNGEKNLYIRIYKRNAQLVCEIEDNGIGREKSMEIRRQNPKLYPSKAISLTRERLHILSSMTKHNYVVEMDDLKSCDGKAKGTKVLVVID